MSKAFTKEAELSTDEILPAEQALPVGSKNYMTPAGYERLKQELLHLIDAERPEGVRRVSWAASNGARSESGDY